MRRDSRIGMAIGGVLVAVLLVYAVVVPKNNKKKVTLDTSGIQAQPTSDSDTTTAAGGGSVSQANATTANPPTSTGDPGAAKPSGDKPETKIYPDREGDSAPATGNNASGTKWAELLAADHVDGATHDTSLDTGSGDTSSRGNGTTLIDPPLEPTHSSPTTRPGSSTSTLTASTHRVASGETFSSIAQAYYGDAKYAGKIAKANPNIDARRLRPGMTIHLPAKGEAVETTSTDSASNSRKRNK